MTRTLLLRPSLCLVVLVALLLPGAYASAGGGGTPMVVDVSNGGGAGCGALTNLQGDTAPGQCATSYVDGDPASCDLVADPTCIPLRVRLISGGKTLALDTRGTFPLRTLILDFSDCVAGSVCSVPPGTDANNRLETPGLLEVFLNDGIARFWFNVNGVDWRVDWNSVDVSNFNRTTMTGTIATGAKPGDDVAGLSQLTGNRTRPRDLGNKGLYHIPFSLTAQPK